MVVVVPTALERELGAALAVVLDGPAADRAMLVAQALAGHRERCTALAAAVITGLEVDSRFTVHGLDEVLDTMPADLWTDYPHLRELVEAHRNLLSMLSTARELVRKMGSPRIVGL